ncbi:hypothetical protein mru_0782 [Methanobrevibacter ruminantium M1]|uniref:DUF5655 domain-containing protein n=1 Tax=Methanobrevibacter ruminantium (strain ATCC 35063 / DSM 1093 / JCM 13430 / OCM 146 / M1) TaxID=634498 RepID=D3E272_METRM|nr:hypothetical protein [Methanobrevibacter ruminantium]ADC46633.1 hypothetical protein mru_0782 [Methanobrevibacter ruminantium M1]
MEYYLQQLTNNHLEYLFELKFVTSEFELPGLADDIDCKKLEECGKKSESLRIDGLGFDNKTNSFVIIEYKNQYDKCVIDQAKCYYKNLLDKKEAYIEKYYEKFGKDKEVEFDFDKTRAIIIGPEFSEQQKNRKDPDFDFELYTVSLCKYNNKIYRALYKKVDSNFKRELYFSSEDLKITRCSLLENKSDKVKKLYKDFENILFERFDDDFILDIRYIVDGVSITAEKSSICLLRVNKKSIKIHFYTDELEDETLNHENICDVIDNINTIYNQKRRNKK